MADPRIPPTDLTPTEAQPIDQFVSQNPTATYTLNEPEKDSPVMQLCRVANPPSSSPSQPSQCTDIAQPVTKVFAHLVKQGFFCQLPFDPAKTEIECVRINKIVQRQSHE
ncbi:hypothetical protein JCM10212_006300 [Sporobolomyces blumeae]